MISDSTTSWLSWARSTTCFSLRKRVTVRGSTNNKRRSWTLLCSSCTCHSQAIRSTRTMQLCRPRNKSIWGSTRRQMATMFRIILLMTIPAACFLWKIFSTFQPIKPKTMSMHCCKRLRILMEMPINWSTSKSTEAWSKLTSASTKSSNWLTSLRKSFMKWPTERRDYSLWSMRLSPTRWETRPTQFKPRSKSRGSSTVSSRTESKASRQSPWSRTRWLLKGCGNDRFNRRASRTAQSRYSTSWSMICSTMRNSAQESSGKPTVGSIWSSLFPRSLKSWTIRPVSLALVLRRCSIFLGDSLTSLTAQTLNARR